MSSLIPGYEYDIFISYRQKDNKGGGWVSEFVEALKTELESTFKEEINVYFDINPHDGLLETHNVDKSLEDKLKCLIFIPIISQTYCDPRSFAWKYELCAFNKIAKEDGLGRDIRLSSGNVASRILPVKIHDLDPEDKEFLENELGGVLRSVEFIYMSAGVNRPLRANEDHPQDNLSKTYYRDQINKVANAIKEIIVGIRTQPTKSENKIKETPLVNKELTMREKSIIVLPFENMSPDPDQEYFSDGLTEEIITDLSHISDLLVISRSSAMTFKGTKKKIGEIAGDVNVRYVLEGSVRKAGNSLRITAQLIDASNDTHIWAEKYNGTLDNVFDIQEKVSSCIAEALKTKFSQDFRRQIAEKSIKDPFVYELYLKARYANWQFDELSLSNGVELLKQGLKIAGENELLNSELCLANVQFVNFLLKDPDTYPELLAQANLYAEKAIKLNPKSSSAYYAKGSAAYQSCHPKEAIQNWRKAIYIEPNFSDPMLFLMLGFMYSMTGFDLKEAEKLLEKGRIMEPLIPVAKTGQGWRLFFEGKFQESLNEFTDWQRQLEQVNSPFLIWFVWLHGLNCDYDGAYKIIDQITSFNPEHIVASLGQFMKYSWMKEKTKALSFVNEVLEKAAWWDDGYSLMMAEGYAFIEEYDKAFHWLNRSIEYGLTNIPFLTEYDHFLENLRKDMRFDDCLKKARKIIKSLSA